MWRVYSVMYSWSVPGEDLVNKRVWNNSRIVQPESPTRAITTRKRFSLPHVLRLRDQRCLIYSEAAYRREMANTSKGTR